MKNNENHCKNCHFRANRSKTSKKTIVFASLDAKTIEKITVFASLDPETMQTTIVFANFDVHLAICRIPLFHFLQGIRSYL